MRRRPAEEDGSRLSSPAPLNLDQLKSVSADWKICVSLSTLSRGGSPTTFALFSVYINNHQFSIFSIINKLLRLDLQLFSLEEISPHLHLQGLS